MAINTSPYDASELRKLRAYLQRFVATLDTAIETVETNENPLWVFKEHSQKEGLRKLAAFNDELNESLIATESGDPFTAETLKPRARVAKSSSSSRGQSTKAAAAAIAANAGAKILDQSDVDEIEAEDQAEKRETAGRTKRSRQAALRDEAAGKGTKKVAGRRKKQG